jgi:hypothetical protein
LAVCKKRSEYDNCMVFESLSPNSFLTPMNETCSPTRNDCMCCVLKVPLPETGALAQLCGKIWKEACRPRLCATSSIGLQYISSTFLWCSSAFRRKAQLFFSRIPYPETGAAMCITGVTCPRLSLPSPAHSGEAVHPPPSLLLRNPIGSCHEPFSGSFSASAYCIWCVVLAVQSGTKDLRRELSAPSIVTRAMRPKSRMNGTPPLLTSVYS